jgi:CarD family transcriptional regulator
MNNIVSVFFLRQCLPPVATLQVAMNFSVGEKVVYPNHGVGVIEQINVRNVSGHQQSFYQLKIVSNSMMVMVPAANVRDVGLRKLIKRDDVNKVLERLKKSKVTNHPDWKNRFKENSEKMRTGCIFEVADVLKSLSFLSHNRILSFREKKMLDRARYLVVSEVATVENLPEQRVEELVDRALFQLPVKRANA